MASVGDRLEASGRREPWQMTASIWPASEQNGHFPLLIEVGEPSPLWAEPSPHKTVWTMSKS